MYSEPELVREHIIPCAQHQFKQGDVRTGGTSLSAGGQDQGGSTICSGRFFVLCAIWS